PERHASVEAAIRGSFTRLDANEREVLAALSVFRGGFDVRSAGALGLDPARIDALRAKSLVRGAGRFDLYARIRSFVEQEMADATMELGKTVLAGGEIDAARAHFERAAKVYAMNGLRPREAQAVALLGAMTGTLGDLVRARAILERAVALAGDDPLIALPALL